MSLKAKIEAVIYASEEPVTLAQLAGLLGHEAQAELDHLDSAQHSLALNEAGTDSLTSGSIDQQRLAIAQMSLPVPLGQLVGDQSIGGVCIRNAQQRFRQAHERHAFFGIEAVGM